jgi:proton-dependent oligopeptide transporter, POT family
MIKQPISAFSHHPRGVLGIFVLQAFAGMGYALLYILIVLYSSRVLGLTDHRAYLVSSTFNALVFAYAILGGYLAGRFLGYRFAIGVSFVLATLAMLILAVSSRVALYWGLSFFVVAVGMLVPCLFVVLGRLYQKDDPRRFSGFILAYIGMNVGGFVSESLAGSLSHAWGYRLTFLFGAIAMLCGLIFFMFYRSVFSVQGAYTGFDNRRPEAIKRSRLSGLCFLGVSLPVTALSFHAAFLVHYLLIAVGIIAFVVIFKTARYESRAFRRKLYAFLVLLLISLVFWTLYMMMPNILLIFISRNVHRELWGVSIHTTTFSALNPLFIIFLGGILSLLWRPLLRRKWRFSTPLKFAIGLFSVGVGYYTLVLGIAFGNAAGMVNAWWVVLSYLLQTLGELLLFPVGFAMVGELVPARLEGSMMGAWQLTAGVGAAIAISLSSFVRRPHHTVINPLVTNHRYSAAFLLYGSIALVVGLITVALIPAIKRLSASQTNVQI